MRWGPMRWGNNDMGDLRDGVSMMYLPDKEVVYTRKLVTYLSSCGYVACGICGYLCRPN